MTTVIQLHPNRLWEEITSRIPVLLLDVRNPQDTIEEAIEGPAVTRIAIPYYEFLEETRSLLSKLPGNRELTVVCCKGNASQWVSGHLAERGFTVRNLVGGMAGWKCLRMPT